MPVMSRRKVWTLRKELPDPAALPALAVRAVRAVLVSNGTPSPPDEGTRVTVICDTVKVSQVASESVKDTGVAMPTMETEVWNSGNWGRATVRDFSHASNDDVAGAEAAREEAGRTGGADEDRPGIGVAEAAKERLARRRQSTEEGRRRGRGGESFPRPGRGWRLIVPRPAVCGVGDGFESEELMARRQKNVGVFKNTFLSIRLRYS